MSRIRWEQDARADLRRYRKWLVREAGDAVATRWIASLVQRIDDLRQFPEQGTPRDDLGPGVRTLVFRGRIVIAYAVEHRDVMVLHLYSRGRDISAADFRDPA